VRFFQVLMHGFEHVLRIDEGAQLKYEAILLLLPLGSRGLG